MPLSFHCYLCSPDNPTSHTSANFSTHLETQHRIYKSSYLNISVNFKGRETRVLFYQTPACPIGDKCGLKYGTPFTNQDMGAHLRKPHPNPSITFLEDMEKGLYLWWWVKRPTSKEGAQYLSPAFRDPLKMVAAIDLLSSPDGPIIDPNDQAVEDAHFAGEDDDIYQPPEELQNEDNGSYDHTTNPDDPLEARSDPIYGATHLPLDQTSQQEDSSSIAANQHSSYPNIPTLVCPPALSIHNFGILQLPQFPNSPNVPVCLRCRRIVNTRSHQDLQRHKCRTNHIQGDDDDDSNEHLDAHSPHNQENESNVGSDVENSLAEDLDPNDVPSLRFNEEPDDDDKPAPNLKGTRTAWKDARIFLEQHHGIITLVDEDIPATIINTLLFLPVTKGFGCSVDNCPRAYVAPRQASIHQTTHLQTEPQGDEQAYTGAPPECLMQTLGCSKGRYSYFRVHDALGDTAVPNNADPVGNFLREAFQPADVGPSGQVLQGLAHTTPFFKRFDYPSIYPERVQDYTSFVEARTQSMTPVHKHGQKASNQFISLISLVYLLEGSHWLSEGDDLTRRQLGSKLHSSQLGIQGRTSSFKSLQKKASLVIYSSLYAALVAYIVGVHDDPSIDSGLVIEPEQHTAIEHFTALLSAELLRPDLIAALSKVHNLSTEEVYDRPPTYFRHQFLRGTVLDACLRMKDQFHNVVFSLVKYPQVLRPSTPIFSTPVIRFLALRGWDIPHKVFHNVTVLHSTMAHLQWCMRMTIYQEHRRLTGLDSDTPPYKILCTLKDQCGCQDAVTPFGNLQDQLRYAGVLATQFTVAPDATWDPQRQAACLNGMQVCRQDFQEMLRTEINLLTTILDEQLLFGQRAAVFPTPSKTFIRPDTIRDIPTTNESGYSYLKANRAFWDHSQSLFKLIIKQPQLHSRFLLSFMAENKPVWNLTAIQQWLTIVDDFKSRLASLVYWLSGMPPRGVEFTSTLIFNTNKVLRNIFCIQGDIIFQHNYTKTESATGFGLPVIHMPAHDLQSLLEEYIVLVKPVYDLFDGLVKGTHANTNTDYRSLLWTIDGAQMTTEQLSSALRRSSNKYLGHLIGIRSWRQIMIQFASNILPPALISLPLTTTALTAQASHGTSAEANNYNRQTDTTFKQVNSARFTQFRCISLGWVEALGFPHPRLRSGMSVTGPDASLLQNAGYIIQEITSRFSFNATTMIDDRLTKAIARIRTIDTNVQSSPRFTPLDITVSSQALTLLSSLYPAVTSFRSPEQGMCIQYALQRSHVPLFVIHPMGHGKSAVYLVPMVYEKGRLTTVVIVPLLSLAQATAINASSLGFKAAFFNPSENAPQGKEAFLTLDLIVLTYDLLVANHAVATWIREMADDKLLARIVVDEAHTLITEAHYRLRFPEVYGRITPIPVPHIFLSGTMPEAKCEEFLQAFQDHRQVQISRLPSDRPNLSYRVDKLTANDKTLPEFCLRIQNELVPYLENNPEARAIVFTRTVAWANFIADHFSCGVYTGPTDLETKQGHLASWLDIATPDLSKRILVGTNSIALGVDQPHVRYVWMFGDPYDSISLAQMAARGGRDGNPAVVTLFPSSMQDPEQEQTLRVFKSTSECRRTPLSNLLDNRRITCFALHGTVARCDNCNSQDDTAPMEEADSGDRTGFLATTANITSRGEDLRSTIVALYTAINLLRASCCFCVLSNKPADHVATECPSGLFKRVEEMKMSIQKLITRDAIPGLSICVKCNMPQKAGHDHGMDHHLPFVDLATAECRLEQPSIMILLALLNAPEHRRKILMQTPGTRSSEVLPSLFKPVTKYPCAAHDTGRQLLVFHFLLISAVAELPHADETFTKLTNKGWFSKWAIRRDPQDSTPGILSEIQLDSLHSQPVVRTGQRRPKRIHESDPGDLVDTPNKRFHSSLSSDPVVLPLDCMMYD